MRKKKWRYRRMGDGGEGKEGEGKEEEEVEEEERDGSWEKWRNMSKAVEKWKGGCFRWCFWCLRYLKSFTVLTSTDHDSKWVKSQTSENENG